MTFSHIQGMDTITATPVYTIIIIEWIKDKKYWTIYWEYWETNMNTNECCFKIVEIGISGNIVFW